MALNGLIADNNSLGHVASLLDIIYSPVWSDLW